MVRIETPVFVLGKVFGSMAFTFLLIYIFDVCILFILYIIATIYICRYFIVVIACWQLLFVKIDQLLEASTPWKLWGRF